ncbi:MAG TPA: ribonuclease HII [Elusimicrobia bacterium]|nr:ribonuclease HII [Elusimicrobiota bacterium]
MGAPQGHRYDASLRACRRRAWLVGVDEAGRGPWAGPVVVAAVRLGAKVPRCLWAARDSKILSARRREALCELIRSEAARVALGWAHPREIESSNILASTLQAMRRAALRAAVGVLPRECLVVADGNRRIPGLSLEQVCVVDGDRLSLSVSCASIVAKVVRDRWMARLDRRYPGYGLARHKGYGTVAHRQALAWLGPAPVHRRTFRPILQLGLPRE